MKKALLSVFLFYFLNLLNPAETFGQKYCKPSFSSGCSNGDSLIQFTLGSYNRSSGCGSSGYDSSTMKKDTIKLYVGRTYKIRMKANKNLSFACWIDLNNNGSFKDPGELMASDNSSADSMNTIINIPETARQGITRMRIMAAYGGGANGFLNDTNACQSFSVGGEAEDYTVLITSYPFDARVITVWEPQNYHCENSAQNVKLVVQNFGSNALTSIPLSFTVGSTTIKDTLKKTLAAGARDTFTFTKTINTSGGGTFSIKTYVGLSTDNDRTNDTIARKLIIVSKPVDPKATNITQCGAGKVVPKAPSTTTGTTTYWYKTNTATTPFHAGDSLSLPLISKDSTFYVQSRYLSSGSLKTQYVTGTPRVNNVVGFDVKPSTNLFIDSFQTHFSPTRTDSVGVYYRVGTYNGFESSQSSWIFAGSALVDCKGQGSPSTINVGNIRLDAGKTYGILLVGMGTYSANELFVYSFGANNYSNADLSLSAGVTLQRKWTFDRTPNRSFDGEIFYHYETCPSGRVALKIDVREGVTGTGYVKGSPFKGVFNAGTAKDPDGVCSGDTVTYTLLPPTLFTNGAYGTDWSATTTFKTKAGTTTTRYKLTNPSSSGNGSFMFYPTTTLNDSTFILSTVVKNLKTGCDSTLTRYIYVSAKPTSGFTSSTSHCMNLPYKPTNTSSISAGKLDYTWYFGDGKTDTAKSPAHYYAKTGTYTVSLVSTAGACKDSTSKTITVYPSGNGAAIVQGTPFSGIFSNGVPGDPDLLCTGDTATYEISPPSAFTNSEYGTKWKVQSIVLTSSSGSKVTDTATFVPSSGKNFILRYTPGSGAAGLTITATITLRALAGNCDSVLYRTFSVGAKPKAWFGFVPVCVGKGAVSFSDSSTISTGFITRKFDFGDGTFSTQKFPNKVYSKAGTYTVTLTVNSDKGCSDVVQRKVTVFAPPKVNFGYSKGCMGKVTSFFDSTSTEGKITGWLWKFGDGTTDQNSNPTHIYSKAGNYTVTLVVSASTGCTDSVKKVITVLQAPTANFDVTTNCLYKPVEFTDKSTDPNGQTLTYMWYFDDGVTSTLKNPENIYTNPRAYDVKLVVTSPSGCQDSITKTVTLFPQPKVAFGSPSKVVCTGRQVVFADSTSFGKTYTWDYGDGSFGTGLPGKHTYTTKGVYTVKLKVESDKGCIDSTVRNITVTDPPLVGFNATTVCVGKETQFTNTSTVQGGALYLWRFGDGKTSSDKDPKYAYTKSGTFSVTLRVINGGGCVDSLRKNVTVNPAPMITFEPMNVTSRKVYFKISDSTFTSYKWSFGDGDSSTEKAPTHTYNVLKGKFNACVEVTNSEGCKATYCDTACVGVDCLIGIEEAVSPVTGLTIYPNPFSTRTTVSFELSKRTEVKVELHDMLGRTLANLDEGKKEAGLYQYEINSDHLNMSQGVYMLKIFADGKAITRQIVLNR